MQFLNFLRILKIGAIRERSHTLKSSDLSSRLEISRYTR